VRRRGRKGIEIVRLMEEERKRRIGRQGVRASKRGRVGRRKGNRSWWKEPYFARSSAGVQILNRILDECISLTRLRPVSTEGPEAGGERDSEGWLRRRDGRDEVGRSQRDNKSVLSSATMGRMEETERRV